MSKTCKVPREWLEGLLDLRNKIDNSSQMPFEMRKDHVNYLLGYLESVKFILNQENEK